MKKSQYENAKDLINKIVVIKTTTGGHQIPVGTKVKIIRLSGGGSSFYHDYGNNTVINASNFELVIETRKQLEKELKDLKINYKKEEALLNVKITFLEEAGLDTYDEMEFKAYSTMSIIEDPKTSKMEKAKLIAELINGTV